MSLKRTGVAQTLFVGVLLIGGSALAVVAGPTAILSHGSRGGATALADPAGARHRCLKILLVPAHCA